jgi:hypothetical protein
MIEIAAIILAVGAFREAAKRRGGRAWPFLTAAALGYLPLGVRLLPLQGRA